LIAKEDHVNRSVSLAVAFCFLVTSAVAAWPDEDPIRETIQRIRQLDAAIEMFFYDHSAYPKARDIHELHQLLVPTYGSAIPTKDGWGTEFRYEPTASGFRIVSAGSDRRFQQSAWSDPSDPHGSATDIVFDGGSFVRTWPAEVMMPPSFEPSPYTELTGNSPLIRQLGTTVNANKAMGVRVDMRTLATAIEAYATDENHYPKTMDISALRSLLEPKYIHKVPTIDFWYVPLHYEASSDLRSYMFVSAGADLRFRPATWKQAQKQMADPAEDAVYSDGEFRREWTLKPDRTVIAKMAAQNLEARLAKGESIDKINAENEGAADHSRRSRTYFDMLSIATALGAYKIDHGHYLAAASMGALAATLAPYMRSLATSDAWGTPFRYITMGDSPTHYRLVAAGADRMFNEKTWSEHGVFDDNREDIVMSDGGFTRSWSGLPASRTREQNNAWNVAILQGGKVTPSVAEVVTLQRAPFVIRVTMPQPPRNVMLNVLGDDRTFNLVNGFNFDDCAKHIGVFCNATGMSENSFDVDKNLRLFADAMHYIYYESEKDHRWSRISFSGDNVIFEREVANIDFGPIEKTKTPALYLTFVIRPIDRQTLSQSDVRRVKIVFR
jgi:Type II secretion system (T2SS), protein G